MRPASAVLVCAVLTTLSIGCVAKRDSPIESFSRSFLESDTAGVVHKSSAGARCSEQFSLVNIGYSENGQGCARQIGDTNFYSWQSIGDKVLVRGKQMSVSAEQLRPLGDSLQRTLTAHLGSGTSCLHLKDFARYSTHFHRWQQKGRTIFLRTIILDSTIDWITIESDSGDRTCQSIVEGGPGWW